LHYIKLIQAHRAFYRGEHRAKNYDNYVKERKNWSNWQNPTVPIDEIEKLFRFIHSWDRFFRGDPLIFRSIHEEIYPILAGMKNEDIVHADFGSEELKAKILHVFDRVAYCTNIKRYESTDASKIIHTLLPRFFVMWDDEIKNWTVQGKNDGRAYAHTFLPLMQRELVEAVETCMTEKKLQKVDAERQISYECGYQTLAKLADEYNYVRYTLKDRSLW
jgi:hypothetical protein